ncbi:pleckstrin homology domain-containing family M member 1-like [Stegodyphus dumicola]|uniref:pleckstrin homology domain-containing family M member 1-like n=1 Tax=Stegodyphus dumicola TaxID=202533 RepID=UPI0015A82FE9|nr:pleckstrin homology domain-containing family M member 1-like [Stegodyphus dumicola]
MDLLWKKAALPTIEDFAKDLMVKKNLTAELGRTIRVLQEENLGKAIIIDDEECVNNFCYALEAIFIHGLKYKLSAKVSSVFGNNSEKMPEPEFWSVVCDFSHKNVILDIKNLSQITTDVGRSRAWLRIALNDGLIVSYVSAMLSDKSKLQRYFTPNAYLRDEEQSDIMKQLLEGTNVFHFELSCNNSALNVWSCCPLTLADLWTPPVSAQPVMPAVDVIDFFTDQKNVIKNSSKNSSPSLKTKTEAVAARTDITVAHSSQQFFSESDSQEMQKSTELEETNNLKSLTDWEDVTNLSEKNGENNSSHNAENILNEEGIADELSALKNLEVSDIHNLDETSSKISSSDSVPDFGLEIIENIAESSHVGSMGNKLNEKSGWSSEFDYESIQRDCEADQSYDSLLQSYNKNLSKVVIGTPELAETFSSVMETSEDSSCNDFSSDTRSPNLDFEIIPLYYSAEHADQETKDLMSLVGKICPEQGLDTQNFQCRACGRPIGLVYGKARLCYYDGYNYCYECHENDEDFIPARIVHNWDFKQYPVSKRAKGLLSRIVKNPMLDIKILNPVIYTAVEEMAQVQLLRTQLTFLRSYIFTCKGSVAEDLRMRLWPREYLYEHVHLYSISDLLEIPSGTLASTLQKAIAFAKKHVSGCQLCLLKGFICEVCKNPKAIYPFDVESTYHCEKCLAVYHAHCMDANKYCPKCMRRIKRQQQLESTSPN